MRKFYEAVCNAEVFLAKTALALITGLVFVAAVARCLRHPIVWAVDMATFLFAWCVFLSSDIALRNNKLVNIDMFVKILPTKMQKFIKLFNEVIIMLFLAALIGYGLWLSYTTRFRAFQGIPGFSYTWVTLSVPVGALLMLVTTIGKIRTQFSRASIGAPAEQPVQKKKKHESMA